MVRRKHSPKFKAMVAIEAIKAEKTISQIATEYDIHPQQVRDWKRQFLSKCHVVFDESGRREKELEKELEKAYKKIGELQVEMDFLSDVLKRA